MKISKHVPWLVVVVVKILLSRFGLPYSFWKRIQLFELGNMNIPQKALDNFISHLTTAGLISSSSPLIIRNPKVQSLTILELGPGDSLFSAVIASSLGAKRTYLIDSGDFATHSTEAYQEMVMFLREKGLGCDNINISDDFDAILFKSNAQYLTEGVHSLHKLSDSSIDFCFSNSVLQHIPKDQFPLLVSEMHRVISPSGVCVHRVDLKDMLGGKLNHLRFPEFLWESRLFRNSGFYTNRFRFQEMIQMFSDGGFQHDVPLIMRWNSLPTCRSSMSGLFCDLPEDELLVSHFDLVLRRKG